MSTGGNKYMKISICVPTNCIGSTEIQNGHQEAGLAWTQSRFGFC
jgi:hypothetical protein